MSTISFAADDDIKARFEALAQRHGFDQSQLLREACWRKSRNSRIISSSARE